MPSLKILPTSIAGSISIGSPAGRQVAGLDRADVELLEREVAAGGDADQVRVRLVGPGEVALALDRRVLITGTSAPTGPDEPGRPELRLDLLGVGLAKVARRARLRA